MTNASSKLQTIHFNDNSSATPAPVPMSESAHSSVNFDITNAIPHCPVILVLDTSHSMWGQGLADMMASLKAFYSAIAGLQFANAKVDIAAVSMGDNLRMLEEFTPIEASGLPNRVIRPKGDTPIGAALKLALDAIRAQLRTYRAAGVTYVTPNLVLLSDGKSTDDFGTVSQTIRNYVKAGKLICRAIALGNSADMTALAAIAGGENVLVPGSGRMSESFARVGQIVSQTYEEEAQDIIIGEARPISRHAGTNYLLDGSNIIHWDEKRNGVTLKPLLAIVNYLQKNGQAFQVLFDASTPYLLNREEAAVYHQLLQDDPDHYQQVPARTRADDFLLNEAEKNQDALILTQDLFRDYQYKYPWLRSRKCVIPGMVMNDTIFFPEISLQIPVAEAEK